MAELATADSGVEPTMEGEDEGVSDAPEVLPVTDAEEKVTPEELAEVTGLARLLVRSLKDAVTFYRKEYGYTQEKAIEAATHDPEFWAREFLEKPWNAVSWREFEQAYEVSPERAMEKWEKIKRSARSSRKVGEAAALAVEEYDNDPAKRARFIAIRHTLLEDWKNAGTEGLLVDLLAEAFYEQERWTKIMVNHLTSEYHTEPEDRYSRTRPPRLTQAEAIERAGFQVDRWNRIFLRNLRALRDLRRSSVININNPSQVNIGEKQVNINGNNILDTQEA